MDRDLLLQLRLQNHQLLVHDFTTPEDVVYWYGAVQAQDYLGSLWALGQRIHDCTERTIEQAISERKIVRSWPMRGTLHFTHAQDLRWMLQLLTPRVIKRAASRYRDLELTDETFKKSTAIIAKALMGGKEMRRDELFDLLEENNVSPRGQRGIHILSHLAMEGLICFGSRQGKQFTFTLLDEWLPATKPKEEDEAIAELTKRYFISHGPATIKDFAWWSGLTITEVKRGLELVKTHVTHETFDKEIYYFLPSPIKDKRYNQASFLPAYDEFTVAYKNRNAIIDSLHYIQAGNGLLATIVFNGKIIGTWKREIKKHEIIFSTHFFSEPNKHHREALEKEAKLYSNFLGKKVILK